MDPSGRIDASPATSFVRHLQGQSTAAGSARMPTATTAAATNVAVDTSASEAPASTPGATTAATPTPMPPKPRKSSSNSGRRIRSGSGNGSLAGAAAPASSGGGTGGGGSSGGIIIGGLRRRPRVTSRGSLNRQGSIGSSDDDAADEDAPRRSLRSTRRLAAAVATITGAASSTATAATPARQSSLRNVASIVRSNIRQSARAAAAAAAAENGTAKPRPAQAMPSFAGVASQVVSTQRAARGFLAMWSQGGGGAVHVYKGIHMEKKKLELEHVLAEFKEIKRRQFYQELVVYALFLVLFFSLLSWLPVHDSYQQNDVVGYLTCREEGVCELKKMGDVYEFADAMASSICNRKDVQAQWQRIGGVRFRQVRVQEEQCLVYNGWRTPCYPFYSDEVELKTPINGSGDSGRVYTWNDGLGLLEPRLSNSIFEYAATTGVQSYGTGGYAVDLCDVDVDDLRADDWLSVATRAFSIEFMLINPVTRVFTIGWHVFTNSPSGHMKHYPHSANLRVVGLEENEYYFEELTADAESAPLADAIEKGDAIVTAKQLLRTAWTYLKAIDTRIVLWIALVLFFVTYCIGEASEMTTMGASTYLKSDMWNMFEMTHLFVLASILTYAMRYYLASLAFASHLGSVLGGTKGVDEIDHSDVQELLRTFQLLSDLASIGSAISLLKVFKFLRMNSTLNLLWRVLGMATRDLMGFLVIFNLIFVGYATMGSYAFGFALEEFSTIGKSYGTCFHMLAGEMDYPRLRQANPRLAPVFIVTFIVLVFQILVNMFVAILSEYYESAKGDEGSGEDVEYDVLARVRNYIKSCSPTVVVKRNEVIRLAPKQQVRLISTNLVDQEETRQRAKKLFRGAVWRVVALLRFGVKFDTRLTRHKPDPVEPKAKEREQLASQIRLSENFDHKAIKEMIPTGITIRLQGDSLLGDALALKVVCHSKLSVECVVLGQVDSAGNISSQYESSGGSSSESEGGSFGAPFQPPRERVLELLGGEKLRIPWRYFVLHLVKNFLKELQESLMRATKLWNYSKAHLVADYHLLLLFESMRDEGRSSLRYDEVYRMLDLFLRKDRKKSTCTQEEVRMETLQVMYRFRKCLIDMPSREKEGHNYRPKPVETGKIELGQLEHLADLLAQNCHEMWALERLKQGWNYGHERDDKKKLHPNLVPYHSLSLEEQQYDYRSSMETLKTIIFMNYTITRVTGASRSFAESLSRSSSALSDDEISPTVNGFRDPTAKAKGENGVTPPSSEPKKPRKPISHLQREAMSFRRNSTMESSPYSTMYGASLELVYCPLPIDTSKVELEPRLLRLVDLLAENAHEVWAKGRMDEGWTYGPQRNDEYKKHPCLVPYIFLTDDEKEYDLNIAKETLKTLIAMKFTLTDRSARS